MILSAVMMVLVGRPASCSNFPLMICNADVTVMDVNNAVTS